MEARRAGEVLLLRGHAHARSSLVGLLAPGLARPSTLRLSSPVSRSLPGPSLVQSARLLSATATRRQDASTPAPKPSAPSPTEGSFGAMLDRTLDGDKGVPTLPSSRTSRFSSPAAQQANRKVSSSLDDMFTAFGKDSFANRITRATDPQGNLQRSRNPPKLPEPPFKLGPSVGRTVTVDPSRGMDVARAFNSMEASCQRNRVRADFNRQRFHERPGLKRKRLKAERWRRRFKEGFRGMVKMVNEMRKQGW
ncbi:hypothetical protein MBLNU459_g2488t1 [Dothideomycetes sp. NU459]